MFIGTNTIAAFFALLALAGGHLRGPTAPEPVVSAAVLGDSYAAGYGADAAHAWEVYTARELGWSLDAVRAYPGAGYVNPGPSAPYEVSLAANPLPSTVTQVIVQGGFNDIAFSSQEVGAAVSRTLALVRAQAPQASITVIGTFDPGPGTFTARYPNLYGNGPAIRQAAEAAGARYVDGFPFRYQVTADGVHPSATGHAQLGSAIAGAIDGIAPQTVSTRRAPLATTAASVIGVSRIGQYGARYFYLASTEGGRLGPVTEMAFGDAGDIPTLLPNAAGECTPAVYRPSTGTLYAATSTAPGAPVEAIPFGDPGDHPVLNAAHGTPSGRSVLIRRSATGTFYQRVVGSDGQVDTAALTFGDRADRGLLFTAASAGSILGVYRPGNSTFYLATPGGASVAGVTTVPFGDPGDQGLVGAWGWSNTDGSDHVGVFRPSTGEWFLADIPTRLTGGAAAPITSVTSFTFGDPGDTALTCDPE